MTAAAIGANVRVRQNIPNDGGAANLGVETGETVAGITLVKDPTITKAQVTAILAGVGFRQYFNETTGTSEFFLTCLA